jgi:hypothetical protein
MWLSLRDYIIVPAGVSQGTINRSNCSGNEEDKLEQLETQTIPTSREISLFIIAFL